MHINYRMQTEYLTTCNNVIWGGIRMAGPSKTLKAWRIVALFNPAEKWACVHEANREQ